MEPERFARTYGIEVRRIGPRDEPRHCNACPGHPGVDAHTLVTVHMGSIGSQIRLCRAHASELEEGLREELR